LRHLASIHLPAFVIMTWKRLLARTSLFTLIIFAGLMIFLDSCVQFRMSKKEIDQYFADKKQKGVEQFYYAGKQRINYLTVGSDSLPLVLFVHGSPGSLSAFIDFMGDEELLQHAQLVSVDRPGFGTSNFGYAEPSLEKQAAQLKAILEKHRSQRPTILVGHSLGGPVIARMAMDYPELVDGLILVAPSLDPDLEPREWFRAPLSTPFLKWILPRSLRASNDEIYMLKPQLQKMVPLYRKIRARTIVIQGLKDDLVDPGNADFARKMISNAPVKLMMVDTMTHFVPWTHPQLIRNAIIELTLPL
jgi:pimeloyl-ACP methyl ester carboxylesterase